VFAREHSNSIKKKPKNFDANFYPILQKGFADWQRRIEYEQRQRELHLSQTFYLMNQAKNIKLYLKRNKI
jgi:hypothetical protein